MMTLCHIKHGTWHFGPPFRHHRLGADRFGAGTSRRWDISAPGHFGTGVSVPDVSARQWKVTVSDPTTSTSSVRLTLVCPAGTDAHIADATRSKESE